MTNQQFIVTEPFSQAGQSAEKKVWEAIQSAFVQRNCLGYWRYPIFSGSGNFRKEPDILLLDRALGIIIIEVKGLVINQIKQITGHLWYYQNFYTSSGNPYQQAENQLFSLLNYCHREASLNHQITSRVLVALPHITRTEWEKREFHHLPSQPPLLLADHLTSPDHLFSQIEQSPLLSQGNDLSTTQWELLLSMISGTPVYQKPQYRVLASSDSRGKVLQKIYQNRSQWDQQQEKIGKQIPPGCQRIRGIAGSGKTALLCQKAAQMHLKYPGWDIALVFFSRSLYPVIIDQLSYWLNRFSEEKQTFDPKNSKLRVLHGWGAKKQPGLYRLIAEAANISPLIVADIPKPERYQPQVALALACDQLLTKTTIPQLFDAILIDEGQDLLIDETIKLQTQQPFYQLAYQALRPVHPTQPQQRRLIWTYDEAQSLDHLTIPTPGEILGEKLAHLLSGEYQDGIQKTETLSRCYRLPHPVITFAHGIGMGLLRRKGLLTGVRHPEDWQALGYEVTGRFEAQTKITLKRPIENSPHPLPQFWEGEIIRFQSYATRQEELTALAEQILMNLRQEGLRPSRQILVLVLGETFTARRLETEVARFLYQQGLDIYLPSAPDCNIFETASAQRNPNQFWCEGGVTVSRIHRAKGQEADLVYIVGLDQIAKDEGNLYLRNQLFTAITRTRAWVTLSGVGTYPFYEEVQQVLDSGDTFRFLYRQPPLREIPITPAGEFLARYAAGERNFQNIDLQGIELSHF
ncbi:MAG: ATP-binding domain-containing protein, partial [Halothece sp. Uz-M2-17]|nr:ATP-binding domain-containing protein [Halothece sp. Uz-M2-17]